MTTALPPHLTATTSDRGFTALPPIPCLWGGDIETGQVRVRESSAATSAALWVDVEQFAVAGNSAAKVTVHMRTPDVLRLADQLVHAAATHYHYRGTLDGDVLAQLAGEVSARIADMLEHIPAGEG